MPDYLLLMHDDSPDPDEGASLNWNSYLRRLQEAGVFQGGSAIGNGICVRKSSSTPDITKQLTGFIRVQANDLAHARTMLTGNPVFEAGGSIEIRELPRSDSSPLDPALDIGRTA